MSTRSSWTSPSHPQSIKASVVVVSWNCRAYVIECLKSMLAHTRRNDVEWIVVDNASTDGTTDELVRRFPEVNLITNEVNLGFAKANNQGINIARGEYIFLVNPDVEFRDDCIGKICRFLDENPSVGVCGPKILNTDGTLQYSCRELPNLWNNICFALALHRLFPKNRWFSNELMTYFEHDNLRDVEALSGCFMVVRKAALKEVGLLDEKFFMYAEDVDWCRRFRDRGWRIVFNPETVAVHHGGKSADNISVWAAVEQDRAIFQYWAKHHSNGKALIIRWITLSRHLFRLFYGGTLYLSGKKTKSAALSMKGKACIKNALLYDARRLCKAK